MFTTKVTGTLYRNRRGDKLPKGLVFTRMKWDFEKRYWKLPKKLSRDGSFLMRG